MRLRQQGFETKPGDFFHLLAGGVEFLVSGVGDARLEGGENVVLGQSLHRDDEGKAELLDIGRIQLGKAGMFVSAQPIKPGAGRCVSSIRSWPFGPSRKPVSPTWPPLSA